MCKNNRIGVAILYESISIGSAVLEMVRWDPVDLGPLDSKKTWVGGRNVSNTRRGLKEESLLEIAIVADLLAEVSTKPHGRYEVHCREVREPVSTSPEVAVPCAEAADILSIFPS